MKTLILLLSLISTASFGIDKTIKSPSGKLILDAKVGEVVQSNKEFKVDSISEKTSTNGVSVSGLNIKSGGLVVGKTSGANPAAGYIGQTLTTYPSGTSYGDGGYINSGTISIGAGTWFVTYTAQYRSVTTVYGGQFVCALAYVGDSGLITGTDHSSSNTGNGAQGGGVLSASFIYRTSSSKTLTLYFRTCGYDNRWVASIEQTSLDTNDAGRGHSIFQAVRILD